MTRLIGPQCLKGLDCNPGKPARPVNTHGYCVQCWMGLSPAERHVVQMAGSDTQPLDALEVWWGLPSYGEGEAA